MAASTGARLRLLHMRDEIESLSNELIGLNFEIYREATAFAGSPNARSRSFPRLRGLCPGTCGRHPDAPWIDIIAIGNPLRHEYHHIDDKVLWETATVDLPKLQSIVKRMIADLED